jgi:endonuclease/exonuclease/phosphatase family metal-dependent hydrolase
MKKVFFNICVVLQVLLFFVLVFTRFIPIISPYEYSIMGVLGLFTPVLTIINILFLMAWLLVRKYWLAGISLLGIILSWNVLSVCFAFNILDKNSFPQTADDVTVMSYNVRLLDLYDWTGKKGTRKKLIELIKKQNADILCLQEFYSKDNSGLDNIKAIKEMGQYPYHAECNLKEQANRKWGSVVFSKYPITNKGNIIINEQKKNMIQECELLINKKKIRLFNIHLHSNKLSAKDVVLEKEGKIAQIAERTIKKSKSIFDKLTLAYSHRGSEVDLSSYLIQEETKYPTIVCGDLNDLPSSYSYFNIRSELKDAFLEKGMGIGATYNGNISFLRIDYIFYQEKLLLNGFKKIKVDYSDHYPLIANFTILD